MRLLFLTTEFPPGPGGIGTHAYEIVRHLSRLGWELRVITPQSYADSGTLRSFNSSQEFGIIRLPSIPGKLFRRIHRAAVVARELLAWRPDAVLASGDPAVQLAASLCPAFRTPWVAVNHGRTPGGWERAVLRWAYARAEAVIFVSRYTREQMHAYGVRPRSSVVIPNGADPERFVRLPGEEIRRFRAESGLNGHSMLLTVGKLSDRKGQDVVIRALPRILRSRPSTVYWMAGVPAELDALRALARRLGVLDSVRFLGQVDGATLLRLLNSCDVFVMTSRHAGGEFEGFGIAVVEAALCGAPSLVSRDSGLPETIREGETGLAAPQDDPEATAEALLALLESEDLRKRLGENARRRALSEQTWRQRAAEYDALLRGVAGPEAAPA